MENTKYNIDELENKYEILFKKMLNGFALHKIVTDNDNKPIDYEFIDINDSFEKMTGLRREDVIGQKVTKVINGIKDDPADWIERYGQVALTGEEDRFESFSSALQKWFSVYAYSPARGYFATIFEDITKQKVTGLELEKQNLLLKNILENAPIGFAVNTVNDGKAIFISKKFKEIYGIENTEINTVEEYFEKVYLDKDFREIMKKRVMDDMATGDPSKMKWENIPITTIDGQKKFITAINIPILDQDIMISTVQDVTRQDLEESELLKSKEMLQSKIDELEKFNKLTINREMAMIELKNKIVELEQQLANK